ncbi:MAG: hypothetical protein OXC68_03810 [Aestuariivita sp.]|nr:hypothetical protein [Aestuariivita sp.]
MNVGEHHSGGVAEDRSGAPANVLAVQEVPLSITWQDSGAKACKRGIPDSLWRLFASRGHTCASVNRDMIRVFSSVAVADKTA